LEVLPNSTKQQGEVLSTTWRYVGRFKAQLHSFLNSATDGRDQYQAPVALPRHKVPKWQIFSL